MVDRQRQQRQQRIRMLSAVGDLQLACSAATFLSEVDENEKYGFVELNRFRCYEQTAISSYARPFSQSRGTRTPSLSLKKCGVILNETEQKLHSKVLDLRNKTVAHSDYELMNFAAKSKKLLGGSTAPFVALQTQFDNGLWFSSLFELLALNDLFRKVLFALYETIHKQLQDNPEAFDISLHYPE